MKLLADIAKTWSGRTGKMSGAVAVLIALQGIGNMASAQEAAAGESTATIGSQMDVTMLIALSIMLIVAILVLFASIYALYALNLVLNKEKAQSGVVDTESFWSKINKRFGAGKLLPVDREKEIMLDHDYDGISELNNHMPPWLRYLFYATIIFGAAYMVHYLVLDTGKTQLEEYHEELAEAEKLATERKLLAGSSIDENSVVFNQDAAALEAAHKLYIENCSACHGADGGGGVGPNLTDEYWLHGGSIQDVFKVIKYGVQQKGMIPWEDKLNPEEIQNVASYILTLQGTTPEEPKEPQGEKYEREQAEEQAVSSL